MCNIVYFKNTKNLFIHTAMRDGVTVTYSVCIGGAGIDYSSVTSILYTYYAFHHPAVLHQWVRATLAQLLG